MASLNKAIFKFCPAAVLLCCLLLARPLPLVAEDHPADTPTGELQRTIELLEDEQRRAEVLKLLKLMAALEADRGGAEAPEASAAEEGEAEADGAGLKKYLGAKVAALWRDFESIPSALALAGQAVKKVFSALGEPPAPALWRPYALKIFIWGLVCLTATWLVMRRYRQPPAACWSENWPAGGQALARYLFLIICPNLLLILTLLAVPPLSPTLPGVTADMATGFTLVQALSQHFFVNLSALYISLKLASALLSPAHNGHALIDVHPMVARCLLRSWRVFSIYVALFIFIDESFLNQFAGGALYSLALVLMTLPLPVYLTFRILELRRLSRRVSEAEASAGEAETAAGEADSREAAPRLDYQADLFHRRYWPYLSIAAIWLMTLAALFNPLGLAGRFGGRIAASMALPALALLVIKASRRLMLKMVPAGSEEGRRALLKADNLINVLVGLGAVFLATLIWGLPLSGLFENIVFRDILGRATAIMVVLIVLLVFIRFSHLATDWLLALPSLESNRNWRTITPLALTTVRALAVFVALVAVLDRLGVNIGPILAGAGILGLGVGMGAQSLVKDLINGLSILMMDTLSVGDWVVAGGQSGTVMSVGIRSLRLRDSAGNLIVVPNSSIDSIVNMTRDYSQDLVEFTAPYDADPDEMLQLAAEAAAELSDDPDWKIHLTAPVAVVGVTAFDANGTTIRLKVSTAAGHQWSVGRELRLRLKRRMMNKGIDSSWFGQYLFLHQKSK